MYGLVNKAIQDLVVATAGEEAWGRIKRAAGHHDLVLDVATNYDDQVSLDLVAAASQVLDMPVETLLFEFGRHWVRYTNSEGWSLHFKMAGDGLIECLMGLDEMHLRVKDAMPDGNMPFFKVSQVGEDFYLDYFSTRTGFVPMVMGILQGLSERFEESWDIVHMQSTQQDNECERFLLKRVANLASKDQQSAA